MTKNSKNFIVTIVLTVLLSFFLPWWSVMVAALITGWFMPLKRVAVFFIPFLAILLFWAVYSYILGSANDFILAKKIAQLIGIGSNPYLLIVVTGTIGGLAAGIAGILGRQIAGLGKSK